MDETTLKLISKQLKKPEGEMGLDIAARMNEGNKEMNLRTIQALNVSPGDNILEIGMGNGFFVKDILSVHPSVNYTGCDYSDLMVEEANKLNKSYVEKQQAQFVFSAGENLPFEDGTFNKLFTVNTIYFWEDPNIILTEFRRVLKQGGLLLITLRPEDNIKNYPFAKHGFTAYSNVQIEDFLASNGFAGISADEQDEGEHEHEGYKFKVASVVVSAKKK